MTPGSPTARILLHFLSLPISTTPSEKVLHAVKCALDLEESVRKLSYVGAMLPNIVSPHISSLVDDFRTKAKEVIDLGLHENPRIVELIKGGNGLGASFVRYGAIGAFANVPIPSSGHTAPLPREVVQETEEPVRPGDWRTHP